MTKRAVLSACATNATVAQLIQEHLRASVGYASSGGKADAPLVLVVSAPTPPRLEAADDVAKALRWSIEGCLAYIDVVPQAVRDADDAARTRWFDDAIPRLFVIRASGRKPQGVSRDYVFKGDKLVSLPPKR